MTRTAEPPPPLDTILYDSPVLRIGKFRVGPNDPRFHDSGPAENHIFVFPRTLVRIRHEGREAFLAGPDVVTYYNRGQVYWRDSVGSCPDRCEWFAFQPQVLREAIRARDPGALDQVGGPFRFTHGPGDPIAYLEQRRVVESLSTSRAAEAPALGFAFEVEETMLHVLDRVLRARHGALLEPTARGERELAEAARVELGRTPGDRRSLSQVAGALGVSVFHLCRVFRRQTGTTLHAYRNRLRLAAALELVPRRRRDLTGIALRLGYSSHSHFTAAFRREFGVTPSTFAQAKRGGRR